MLPYSCHDVSDDDVKDVVAVLTGKFLTTGPSVSRFENDFAEYVGAGVSCIAVANGTAALHCAVAALKIGPGDEVIVPPLTFCSTANVVLLQRASVKFADIDYDSMCILASSVEAIMVPGVTKAVIAVDYAGRPCDYDELRRVCAPHDIKIVADASHSFGATYKGKPVGQIADISTFSFHPVKNITTGEGGLVVTGVEAYASACRRFRSHGIESDPMQRMISGIHSYEMISLGLNYRLTDIQAALGIAQLRRLPEFISRRQEIAEAYRNAFQALEPVITTPRLPNDITSAYHLYVIRVHGEHLVGHPEIPDAASARDALFLRLRQKNLGVNVHYPLVHRHPYYMKTVFDGNPPSLSSAERVYGEIISFPIFPKMSQEDVSRCILGLSDCVSALRGEIPYGA